MIFLLLSSCSNDSETQSLIEDKLETMSGKEMLRELLITNDNDIQQLSRVFQCSSSSLNRILHGETIATTEAKNQFKITLNQTLISKEKTLDQIDPYKSTYLFKILFFFKNNYIPFIIVLVFAIIIDLCDGAGLSDKIFLFWLICLFIFLLVVLVIWIKGEPIIIDNFKNTIDPIWELIK